MYPANAEAILGRLPERIRVALIARTAEIEHPVAAVVEMAIASFLGVVGSAVRNFIVDLPDTAIELANLCRRQDSTNSSGRSFPWL
jgi:hypothetical protein